MVKVPLIFIIALLSGCNIIVIKHEEGTLPEIDIKSTKYFCENGKTKVDVDSDEIVITCKIKF